MPHDVAEVKIIKRIHPISLAKFSAVMSGIVGVLYGFWIAAMILYIPEIAPKELNLPENAVLMAAVMVGVATPLFMIVFGLLYGLLAAFLYNWLASWVGGIRIDLVTPWQPGASGRKDNAVASPSESSPNHCCPKQITTRNESTEESGRCRR